MDETSRKLAERERLASLGTLLTGVVHEINNPIGSIVSNNEVSRKVLETLKVKLTEAQSKGEPPSAKAVEWIDTLLSLAAVDRIACERITAVVRSLKVVARHDQGEFRKVPINDLLRDTLKLISCQYRQRIRLDTDFGDIPEITCSPQRLSQVFLNLLVNAAQAIEAEGVIRVSTRSLEGGEVEIAFKDTGKGILPEHQSQIFREGFTTKPLGVGTGFGLSLSRTIIEEDHGGRIWFETQPGCGTTFFIRIKER